jgi:hypothetical protein
VRLRNISFNGADLGLVAIRILGGATIAAGVVIIEDCLINGNFGGSARGISDERVAGGKLLVSNTTIRNIGSKGLTIDPGPGTAGQRVDATLDNVLMQSSGFGATFGNNVRVMINRSVISGNSIGIAVQTTLAASEANISNSVISNNGTGVFNAGGTLTIRLANNDIAFNTTALSGGTQSFNNNRIQGNGSLGTAPTVIGATSNPTGQQ